MRKEEISEPCLITFARYLCILGRVPFLEKKESVSNYNNFYGDGSEKDAKIQIEFAFCQTLFKLIASFKPTPGDFCWSWIPKGCIQVQKTKGEIAMSSCPPQNIA